MKWNNRFSYPKSMRSIINGSRHYSIKEQNLPSVTSILKATESDEKKASIATTFKIDLKTCNQIFRVINGLSPPLRKRADIRIRPSNCRKNAISKTCKPVCDRCWTAPLAPDMDAAEPSMSPTPLALAGAEPNSADIRFFILAIYETLQAGPSYITFLSGWHSIEETC